MYPFLIGCIINKFVCYRLIANQKVAPLRLCSVSFFLFFVIYSIYQETELIHVITFIPHLSNATVINYFLIFLQTVDVVSFVKL